MRVDAVPQPASPAPEDSGGQGRGRGTTGGGRAMTGGLGSRVLPFLISEGERPKRGPKRVLINSLASSGW